MSSNILSINSNLSSLTAQRQLDGSTSSLSSTYERLSSGLRINHASDDAAGLAISSNLKAASRVYAQAVRNISDGISYLSVGEGALKELSGITARQLELAEQAANGVYSLAQRRAVDAEANALADEYNRIVQSTEFNNRHILDPQQDGEVLILQCGTGTDGTLQIDIGDAASRTVGNGTFGTASSYQSESGYSTAVTLADLNGDGITDIISAGYDGTNGYATIGFGKGDGTFQSPVSYQMEQFMSWAVSVTDVNGDGVNDLVTAGRGSSAGRAVVRLGMGNGTFGSSTSYLMEGYSSYGLSLTDVNSDGKLDLVTAGRDGTPDGIVTIRLGNGNGTFGSALSYVMEGNISRDVEVADINGDGYVDLLTVGNDLTNGYATIRLGNNNGTFGSSVSYMMDTYDTFAVSLSDIDGDGVKDLVSTGQANASQGSITIRLGKEDGTFGDRTVLDIGGAESRALSVTDINGDGIYDLVTAGRSGGLGYATISLGNGDGTFASRLTYQQEGSRSYGVAAGDLDDDGALDLVTAGDTGSVGAVIIRLGTPVQVATMAKLNLLSVQEARSAITTLKEQLDRVSAAQGVFGAFESRASVASRVLQVSRENYLAADSRIEDTDTAVEAASLIKNQILQQAASSVLAQANQVPALALKLLK